jgi:TRAP-type transport system small permease protein
MRQLNQIYGHLLEAMALLGALLLFVMMMVICTDVGMRTMGLRGVPWATEVSEYILYLSTFLAAPFLLRHGRHVRLDLGLRALPPAWGWRIEWIVDAVGILVCLILTFAGARVMLASRTNGNIVQKTLEFSEWFLLIPVPVAFLLLAVEFMFRMYRLSKGPRTIRDEATSTA